MRKGHSLKSSLFRRAIALDFGFAPTVPCTDPSTTRRGARSKSCPLTSGSDSLKANDIQIRTRGGSCKSKNIIYAAQCTLCSARNTYVGETVTTLATRINGHRSKFYALIRDPTPLSQVVVDDANILGAHLVQVHGLSQIDSFDLTYKFSVVAEADPSKLRQLEQHYIEKLGTLYPFGLNQIDSIQTRCS